MTEKITQPSIPADIKLPSRAEIEAYVPKPELYLAPDIPHHGVTHGEETAIWAGVLTENLPERQRAMVDGRVILNAAAYHDSGRLRDWGILQREMKAHGPRGAQHFRDNWGEIDPSLTDEQVDGISRIINLHTPNIRDRYNKRSDQKNGRDFEDYEDPDELMLHIVQDADTLGLVRGYYSRRADSLAPTPWAVMASTKRALLDKPESRGHTRRNLRFPITDRLYHAADALARMSRQDPELDRRFKGHRSGAALEAAERLGIVK